MGNKILIAYASTYGSTGEVAECIGQFLRDKGGEVDVRSVKEIKDISPYQSVVIGSATKMYKLLPDALKFAKKHAPDLRKMKTAYFVVGVTLKQDTPENREKVKGFLKPLCQIQEPISLGLFADKLDYSKLGVFWKVLASKDKSGLM